MKKFSERYGGSSLRFRHMAVAFLINEMGQIIFLQKDDNSSFLAGHLVPIGGHI